MGTEESSFIFSTESLYNCLTHGGVKDKPNDFLWKSKIPFKVKVFLCQAFHNKLSFNKKGVGMVIIFVVSALKSKPLTTFCLSVFLPSMYGVASERLLVYKVFRYLSKMYSISGRQGDWFYLKNYVFCFLFAGLAWAIWKNRNKIR